MSYHILHLLTPDCFVGTDRGFIVCKYKNGSENKLALADIRAVVAIAQGISFSNSCLAKLLSQDSIILHCDNKYKPIGWTSSFSRVIRDNAFTNQLKQNKDFTNLLWNNVVKQKALNQSFLLEEMNIKHELYNLLQKEEVDEANIARRYWSKYLGGIDNEVTKREYRNADDFANKALNYGYAVISTLIHRSILIHGLLPELGIHHKSRYRNTPLVFDLMEPFRIFIDKLLYIFLTDKQENSNDFNLWIKFLSESLRNLRINSDKLKMTYKLMDSIDEYINRIVKAFIEFDISNIWLPDIRECYWHNSK
jgi:CRISP-associated protein Cas1